MQLSKIEKTVYDMAAGPAAENGLEVYDVEFVKEGGARFLRIFLDKSGGITIDECEEFSRVIGELLDEKDPIPQNYYLEVSSPGIERRLRHREHFEKAVGETVDIHLYKAINGSKTLTGILTEIDDENNITIEADGEKTTIPQSAASRANVHFDF